MENEKSSSNTMLFVVLAVIVIALIGVCVIAGGKGKESSSNNDLTEDVETIMTNLQSESEAVDDNQKGEFGAEISVTDYMDLLNIDEEYSLVWVARPTCSYCELTTPIIQKLIKDYSIYISYLNTDEFSEDDSNTFINSDDRFKEGFGTPMLLLVGDGQLLDMVDGATDTAHYIEFLKTYKFIEE